MVNNGFEAAAFSPYCHFAAFSGRKRLVPAGASARRTVAELQKTLYRIFGRCSQRVLCGQLGFELHPPASSPAPSPSPVHAKHCTGEGEGRWPTAAKYWDLLLLSPIAALRHFPQRESLSPPGLVPSKSDTLAGKNFLLKFSLPGPAFCNG